MVEAVGTTRRQDMATAEVLGVVRHVVRLNNRGMERIDMAAARADNPDHPAL